MIRLPLPSEKKYTGRSVEIGNQSLHSDIGTFQSEVRRGKRSKVVEGKGTTTRPPASPSRRGELLHWNLRAHGLLSSCIATTDTHGARGSREKPHKNRTEGGGASLQKTFKKRQALLADSLTSHTDRSSRAGGWHMPRSHVRSSVHPTVHS